MDSSEQRDNEVKTRQPVVWITNYAGHEFSLAKQYGELRYITKGYISFSSLDRLKFHIAGQLVESQPEDYLLLSGTIIICVIAAIVWFKMHKKIKLLNWDRKSSPPLQFVADSNEQLTENTGAYREMVITDDNLTQLLGVIQS